MPTYDYRCGDCGHVFEIFHGMTEQPRLECPKCGGTPQRLISGGGAVILAGLLRNRFQVVGQGGMRPAHPLLRPRHPLRLPAM